MKKLKIKEKFRAMILSIVTCIFFAGITTIPTYAASSEVVPTVTTGSTSSITVISATLSGVVNANNASTGTTVTFQYGLTTAYGSTVPATPSPVDGNTDTAVTANLSGLEPGTTYHYRVLGSNSVGTTFGEDKTFTTVGVISDITTGLASSITSSRAILSGTVNAKNARTTVTFEYGPTVSYGSTITAIQSPVTGNVDTKVTADLSGLSAGTLITID